jgi:hypothetical protein
MTESAKTRNGSTRRWRKMRSEWQMVIDQNIVNCMRCGQPIYPGEPWHLGHKLSIAAGGTDLPDNCAPEHPTCNLHGSATPVQIDEPTFLGWC